jgi:hypothetical protein
VPHERDKREDEYKVDHSTGDVKHTDPQKPEDEENDRGGVEHEVFLGRVNLLSHSRRRTSRWREKDPAQGFLHCNGPAGAVTVITGRPCKPIGNDGRPNASARGNLIRRH